MVTLPDSHLRFSFLVVWFIHARFVPGELGRDIAAYPCGDLLSRAFFAWHIHAPL
jgi:hypothetical protein